MNDLKPMAPLPPQPIPAPAIPAAIAVPPNRPSRSRTVWGLVIVAAGFILTALDAPADVSFLADGFQPEDVGPALTAAGGILAAIGIRFAKPPAA